MGMAGCVLFPETESPSSWISGEARTTRPVQIGFPTDGTPTFSMMVQIRSICLWSDMRPPRTGNVRLSSPPALPTYSGMKRQSRLLPRRRHRGRFVLGAIKPASKLDPGFLEHLSLSPRAVNGPGARSLEFLAWDPHAGGASGGDDGGPASALFRS